MLFPGVIILMLSFSERTEVSIWDRKYTTEPKIVRFFLKEDHEPQQDQGPQQRSYEAKNTRIEWNAWWPQKICRSTRKKVRICHIYTIRQNLQRNQLIAN